MAATKKPTAADAAKRKAIALKTVKSKDPALTKKPSISSLIGKPKNTVTPKPRVSPLAKRPAAAREPEIVNPRTMSPADKAAYYDRQKAYEKSQGLTVPKKRK